MSAPIKITIDAADWQKQVNGVVKTMEKLLYHFDDERRAIFEDGAQVVISEVQSRAPVGDKLHVRYPSLPNGAKKARKGEGKRVATYHPGNLKRSFGILKLRRKEVVIVGAILKRAGQTKGTFAGLRADGYYLGFVEYDVEYGTRTRPGRPFVRPAYISAAPKAIRAVKRGCDRFAASFAKRYAYSKGR